MKRADQPTALHVIARSPFEIHYEGPAQAVSATNAVGDFDILPGHADFFSILAPGEVVVDKGEGDPISVPISNGILTVRDNEVMLFINM